MTKISYLELAKMLEEWNTTAKTGKLTLTCTHGESPLFTYEEPSRQVLLSGRSEQSDGFVLDALDRSNALNLEAQYFPSAATESSTVRLAVLLTEGITPQELKKTQAIPPGSVAWKKHIESILYWEGDFVNLVLDTNIIYRHYATNIFLKAFETDPLRFQLKIPRLVLLELERRFNANSKKTMEKRLALEAGIEIKSLQDEGASLLPELDLTLLEGFSRLAGEKFVDAWIRREVSNFVGTEIKPKSGATIIGSPSLKEAVIFLTCDLMNALAAQAEGISTIFLSRSKNDVLSMQNPEQTAKFFLEVAITFEKIEMKVSFPDETTGYYELRGMWTGKTVQDWTAHLMLLEEHPPKS